MSRALHSVSSTCGPKGHEDGHVDVIFKHRIGVVVPPGVVNLILETIKPIMTYERDNGGLYTADEQLPVSLGWALRANLPEDGSRTYTTRPWFSMRRLRCRG